ncbi:MAG TPA: LapA family protein [Trueperaceae bacterium]
MRFKGVLITLVAVLGLLFALLNWELLFQPTPVNLLLGTVEMPLGFSLLLFALAVSLLFFLAALWERARQLQQVTHQERVIENLQARLERKRTEDIEALDSSLRDRIDTIRQQIETDTGRVEANLKETLGDLEGRLGERMDMVQERVVLVRNELAADIGELEDRMQRERVQPNRDGA